MRTTEDLEDRRRSLLGNVRLARSIAIWCTAGVVLLAAAGCSGVGSGMSKSAGSKETTAVGRNMAGAAQDVIVSKTALMNKPKPWVLDTPESAIRSYLDWVSYAYRIGESSVATPTMSDRQEVRIDSYVQFNLEKAQLLDQTLQSITLGKPSVSSTSTLLPATEHWTYRYVSIKDVDKTVGGPYTADYKTTYTVVKNKDGNWVVDKVAVKALGNVK